MEQYIPKSVLLAEIERLKADALQKKGQCKRRGLEKIIHQIGAYNKILSFIDTLEVKEVDLDAELEHYKAEQNIKYEEDINMFEFARHFFELGLSVSNKAQKGE